MPAPKGHAKWGGRKKGSLNKARQLVLDLVKEKCGTTPAEVLAEAMLDPARRDWAAKELLPYCYPKLSSTTLADDPENPPGAIVTEKKLAFAADALAKMSERKRGQ